MRKLLLNGLCLAVLSTGCDSSPLVPKGPGKVIITESTTSTTTSTTTTTTTSTIPLPTVALFRFSPVTPQEWQIVFFNASDSTPGTGRTIVDYSWDFGDGSRIKTGVTTSHDFGPTGIFLVTLTVTDDLGKAATSSQPITVRPAPPPVVP